MTSLLFDTSACGMMFVPQFQHFARREGCLGYCEQKVISQDQKKGKVGWTWMWLWMQEQLDLVESREHQPPAMRLWSELQSMDQMCLLVIWVGLCEKMATCVLTQSDDDNTTREMTQ